LSASIPSLSMCLEAVSWAWPWRLTLRDQMEIQEALVVCITLITETNIWKLSRAWAMSSSTTTQKKWSASMALVPNAHLGRMQRIVSHSTAISSTHRSTVWRKLKQIMLKLCKMCSCMGLRTLVQLFANSTKWSSQRQSLKTNKSSTSFWSSQMV